MSQPLASRNTIAGRLNRLVVLSVGVALLLGALMACWAQAKNFIRAKRDVMLATAQVFAAASSRAVAAGDETAVMQALRAVSRVPGLVYIDVRGLDGRTLGQMGSGARLAGDLALKASDDPSPAQLLATRSLTLTVPVIDGGRTVGEIEVVTDTTELAGQFWSTAGYAALGSIVAICIGLAFAFRLQRSITRPLQDLTGAMLAVEHTHEYDTPVRVESNDEFGLLAGRFNSMMTQIREASGRILAREEEIIERLSRAGEMRDDQTGQHVIRVAKISRLIATELGLDRIYINDLCRASPMHDVGKISIPDAILHKPGRLDPKERHDMEQHAARGYEILQGSSSDLVQLAAEIALSHHERWDGQGYPNKVAGADIPLSGRITAVADVCDALLSERPYKKPWPLEQVRTLLVEEAGAHFDPDCVSALMARWAELERIYVPQVANDLMLPTAQAVA